MTERPSLLLCTDLDRTLLPNGPQPESPGARALFTRLVSRPDVMLAYVTGRHLALAEQAIGNYGIPLPDYLISDVGTRIHQRCADRWQTWHDWEAEIDRDWAGHDHAALARLFGDLRPLRLQEAAKQSTHKLSYYVPVQAHRQQLTTQMKQRLDERGIHASLVWSIDEPAGIGLLDVLPERATKLHAIEFLQQHHDLSHDDMLFAGDSGNDLQVLTSAIPSVLVANASAEVREAAQAAVRAAGHADRLYLAVGGQLGMNGNYSAGILEGVAHYHPELMQGIEAC